MANIETLKAMRIGCDNAVWTRLVSDDGVSAPTYYQIDGVPQIYKLPGVMMLNINPNTSMETAFYDDGPGEVASTLGNIELTFNKSALSPSEKAMLLGKAINNQGVLFHNKLDVAPWGALGFRTLKSDGTYRYIWLYKGKFIEPNDENETKGDSINFQSDEITGRFVKLNWPYMIENNAVNPVTEVEVKPWKADMDSTDFGGVGLNNIWFENVVLPDSIIIPPAQGGNSYIGYVMWTEKDGSTSYFVELNDPSTITLNASSEIDTTKIASNYFINKGVWELDPLKTHNKIDKATQIVGYSSVLIKDLASVTVAQINYMPGLTLI